MEAKFPVLLPPLRGAGPAGKAGSSWSSGVGSGEGKCRLDRSGSEPPVLSVSGTPSGAADGGSGELNTL